MLGHLANILRDPTINSWLNVGIRLKAFKIFWMEEHNLLLFSNAVGGCWIVQP